jgi:hypothetical protein
MACTNATAVSPLAAPVTAPTAPSPPGGAALGDKATLRRGIAVGLVAASIGALYTVFARWGVAQGLAAQDMTVLRFGVAGLLTLPVLWIGAAGAPGWR